MINLIELIVGTCMVIVIWREILEPLLWALLRITATFRRILNYKSEPSDPAIRFCVSPHISPEDFNRLSVKEQEEIIDDFTKDFHRKFQKKFNVIICDIVQNIWFTGLFIIDFFCILGENQEGTLTDEMMFENGKHFEPCEFCSPQDCDCTYEQYQLKMEMMKRMEKEHSNDHLYQVYSKEALADASAMGLITVVVGDTVVLAVYVVVTIVVEVASDVSLLTLALL
ncbi:hypothetical protein RhiirA5_415938 [Rhizophagus irregularis]|uniref:Uncharacterized protein n=1 Tax=Rhizophagus irregularis TaxID=588596 RepID=A0A2N0PQY6_9GLOM|nr:hypothetical protein RhiirA5_415938 [Rhizophagus irregularis]